MTFDFKKLAEPQRHTRCVAIVEVGNYQVMRCQVDLVGEIPTQISFTSDLSKGQIMIESDEEEMRSFAHALRSFAQLVTEALEGDPNDPS